MSELAPWALPASPSWRRLRVRTVGRTASGIGFPPALQGEVDLELPFYKVKHLGQASPEGVLESADDTISYETAESLGATIFPAGTLVYAKVGAALMLGRVRVLPVDACIDNNMAGLIPSGELDSRFLYWAMSQVRFDYLVNPGAVPSLSDRNLLDFPLLVPSRDEQRAIADYLDRETAHIDTLIEEQQRLITMLVSRKAAVVDAVVTRGLAADSRLGDSGVDWLGPIPEGWQIRPLWSMFRRIKDVNHPEEQMLSVFRDYGVVAKESRANINKTAENRNIYQLVHPGWLVTNRMKAWQGSVGISTLRGIVSGHYICFSPLHSEYDAYLNWLFRSPRYAFGYRLISRGVRIGQAEIDNDEYRVLPVVVPPLDEQQRIAAYLDQQTAKIDTTIAEAERFIELVRERRAALITAAVTGQIDVREMV